MNFGLISCLQELFLQEQAQVLVNSTYTRSFCQKKKLILEVTIVQKLIHITLQDFSKYFHFQTVSTKLPPNQQNPENATSISPKKLV
jgi:hypothetical protein